MNCRSVSASGTYGTSCKGPADGGALVLAILVKAGSG
jgi:hypothetical protein